MSCVLGPKPVRRTILAVIGTLGLVCGFTPAAADDGSQGRLVFLGVAYDAAPPTGFDANHYNYAPDNVSDLLAVQSKDLFRDFQRSTLKGSDATRDQVIAALRQTGRQVGPDDFVVFYWGTHAQTTLEDGWHAGLPDGGVIYAHEIKAELAAFPCPVLVILSACGSGGFAQDNFDGVLLPTNVIALCACRRDQTTTNEIDRAVLEALAGFGDADDSGTVTIRELVDYIPKRYRRWFPRAEEVPGGQVPVLKFEDTATLDIPLTKVNGTHFAVVRNGAWYGATAVGDGADGPRVRFLGYDATTTGATFSMPDAPVDEESIDRPGGFPPVEVKQGDAWWPARILSRHANRYAIHYIGFPESDDETVTADRIRYPFVAP